MLSTICITLFIVKVTFDIFVISKYFIAVLFNVHLAHINVFFPIYKIMVNKIFSILRERLLTTHFRIKILYIYLQKQYKKERDVIYRYL